MTMTVAGRKKEGTRVDEVGRNAKESTEEVILMC